MNMPSGFKLDLHTHSYGSPDGGLKLRDYHYFLQNKLLDYIAITDHNSIDAAQQIRTELGELGAQIIIGEEITTQQGEIIGLYLRQPVPSGLSIAEAATQIHGQGGLVYIPHPFETVRSGVSAASLATIAGQVDIMETGNGRAVFQNRGRLAVAWASQHRIPGAASSDAHGRFGWGNTFSLVSQPPTRANLLQLLHSASLSKQKVGLGIIYPKLNRLHKKLTVHTGAGAGKH